MSNVHAGHAGICWICEHTYDVGDPIVHRRDEWIHPHCAPGGSDE